MKYIGLYDFPNHLVYTYFTVSSYGSRISPNSYTYPNAKSAKWEDTHHIHDTQIDAFSSYGCCKHVVRYREAVILTKISIILLIFDSFCSEVL